MPAFSVAMGEKVRGKSAEQVRKAAEEFTAKGYHTPLDEFREDWDFTGFPVLIRLGFASRFT